MFLSLNKVNSICLLVILHCKLTGFFEDYTIARKVMKRECSKSKCVSSVTAFFRAWLVSLVWTSRLSFIISSVCLESCHVALGFYHEVVKAKQAEWLSSPGPGRVGSSSGTYHIHLALPFRCDLNSFAPPLLLASEPHVWCERMTPPLPLPSWYGPHSLSNEL